MAPYTSNGQSGAIKQSCTSSQSMSHARMRDRYALIIPAGIHGAARSHWKGGKAFFHQIGQAAAKF